MVNTSSFATLDHIPGHAPYTASKAAVDGISDILREELVDHGDDFGVTVLYPGLITTNIAETSAQVHERLTDSDMRDAEEYVQRQERGTFDHESFVPKDPDVVGPQVMEAIRNNDPYCLTHPAPIEALRRRTERWAAGYRVH
jgi:short-subunit dehydrogenase